MTILDDFTLFFEVYNEQVYGYVVAIVKNHETAEEITQDIFIKLWACQDILDNIKNIDSYIYILARNRALNHLRKVKYDQTALAQLKVHITEGHHPVEEYMLERDYEALVSEAISTLSPQRKTVYLLSREDGMSISEIADKLQLSPSTVKNHLVASLKSIRGFLAQHGDMTLLLTMFMFL